jgi:hypothetical protein
MDTVTDTITYDGLVLGGYPTVTKVFSIGASQTLVRGTVLGKVTSGGALIISNSAASDGSQVAYAILAVDITTTSAADALCYVAGKFNDDALTYYGTDDIDDHYDNLRAHGIFVVTTADM